MVWFLSFFKGGNLFQYGTPKTYNYVSFRINKVCAAGCFQVCDVCLVSQIFYFVALFVSSGNKQSLYFPFLLL